MPEEINDDRRFLAATAAIAVTALVWLLAASGATAQTPADPAQLK